MIKFVKSLIWLTSALLAFVCLGSLLQALFEMDASWVVLSVLGMMLGTLGVMAAALMED